MEKKPIKNGSQQKKFTEGYTFKVLLLTGFLLLLLIPLSMIRGLIDERGMTAQFAESDIMAAWGSELAVVGPILTVPVRTEGSVATHTMVIMPQQLNIRADLSTEVRRRGIFSVPLFSGELTFFGSFDPALASASLAHNQELLFDQAELVIALSSQQGIRRIERAFWNNGLTENADGLFFQPGNRNLGDIVYAPFTGGGRSATTRALAGGIFAALPNFIDSSAPFAISISMQGGRMVRFLPIGQQTHVLVSSDWASPSFQGSFLPVSSEITPEGFFAEWDISYLSRDIPLFWINETRTAQHSFSASLFGVDFFRAIDTYSLNTRTTRYALLFLVIPFLALFLLEIHSKKRIHPVQYLLSGIANVIFYLLLLSFSEQMQFHLAYLISAFAVTILLTLYSRSLLPSWGKSFYFAAAVSLSYILLYAILNAESFALLIGSVYAFALIALVMFLTRKMDWYGISFQIQNPPEKTQTSTALSQEPEQQE